MPFEEVDQLSYEYIKLQKRMIRFKKNNKIFKVKEVQLKMDEIWYALSKNSQNAVLRIFKKESRKKKKSGKK